ncbi:MAG: tail fiber domain-containing protein [Bacteroidales bacterium]|nr:tail fiber domain-containing protein [Bacteroidales bacterium]
MVHITQQVRRSFLFGFGRLGSNSLVSNASGSYNTAIGYNTGPNAAALSNTTTLGIDARATATDQVRIGNVFVNSIGGYVNWSNISDGRFKENLSENVPGLSFITQLRPVTYRLNRNAINAYIGVDAAYKGEAMSGITSGFVAQEVEKAAQQLGYDFSGVDAPKNDKDVYALRYADFVVPLVKAVQEQQQQITDLKNDNTELKSVIEELRAINLAIEQRLKALEGSASE